MIEHNLDLIQAADWVIDIGPEGGEAGGRIIAQGTPEAVAAVAESYTGQYLKQALEAARHRLMSLISVNCRQSIKFYAICSTLMTCRANSLSSRFGRLLRNGVRSLQRGREAKQRALSVLWSRA